MWSNHSQVPLHNSDPFMNVLIHFVITQGPSQVEMIYPAALASLASPENSVQLLKVHRLQCQLNIYGTEKQNVVLTVHKTISWLIVRYRTVLIDSPKLWPPPKNSALSVPIDYKHSKTLTSPSSQPSELRYFPR